MGLMVTMGGTGVPGTMGCTATVVDVAAERAPLLTVSSKVYVSTTGLSSGAACSRSCIEALSRRVGRSVPLASRHSSPSSRRHRHAYAISPGSSSGSCDTDPSRTTCVSWVASMPPPRMSGTRSCSATTKDICASAATSGFPSMLACRRTVCEAKAVMVLGGITSRRVLALFTSLESGSTCPAESLPAHRKVMPSALTHSSWSRRGGRAMIWFRCDRIARPATAVLLAISTTSAHSPHVTPGAAPVMPPVSRYPSGQAPHSKRGSGLRGTPGAGKLAGTSVQATPVKQGSPAHPSISTHPVSPVPS
mmetsp:Transcript_11809/g.24766  ORF Transcript_11809/g.24766 Transcript_11809/m.24766 type:complete len:306 (+) Transcript_11809:674-1591(+)